MDKEYATVWQLVYTIDGVELTNPLEVAKAIWPERNLAPREAYDLLYLSDETWKRINAGETVTFPASTDGGKEVTLRKKFVKAGSKVTKNSLVTEGMPEAEKEKLLDLETLLAKKPMNFRPESTDEQKYKAKRANFAIGKARMALTRLHPNEYRELYVQALELYDKQNGR